MNKSQARNTVPEFYSGRNVTVMDKINVLEVYLKDRKYVWIKINYPTIPIYTAMLNKAFEFACGWYVQNPDALLRN